MKLKLVVRRQLLTVLIKQYY